MPEKHKAQHSIPRTYLAAWHDPIAYEKRQRIVHRYNKDGRYRDYRPPTRIFTVDDLYTTRAPDGSRDLRTEHALTQLEDAFARCRDRYVLKQRALPPKERGDLVWFISALRNRTPAMHAHHRSFLDRVIAIAAPVEAALKSASPAKRLELANSMRGTRTSRTDTMSLAEVRARAAAPFGSYLPDHIVTEARLLEQMELSILCAPEGHCLITSDRPVTWWDPVFPPGTAGARRPGLGHGNIEVSLPLTPDYCALVSHRPRDEYMDISHQDVDEINMRTLHRCQDVFIANSPHLKVEWFA